MNTVFVLADDGTKLMPTHSVKARHLLKSGKAIIHSYKPFTIQLTYQTTKNVQSIEVTVDTGYGYIGLSVKSDKHEYISNQYDLLPDEVEHHNNQRKYRRTRRNRKRYRESRFNNRKTPDGWFTPSLQHKIENHVSLIKKYIDVCPVDDISVECGQFDTQVLKAIQEGKPIPQKKDYQHGEQYGYDTLKEAVFSRDNYTCQICKKTPWKDGISLHRHHIGYWHNDRTNRMSNILTVGSCCHTPKNHQPGGKLYGLKTKVSNMAPAAFMNAVKYEIYRQVSQLGIPTHITYGAETKRTRKMLNIGKTHADDAYCIGKHHPKHKTETQHFKKRRRNNRVLSKFYDAKYIDSRDGEKRSGKELSNGRTNRNHNRDTENLHQYRQQKVSKGRTSIRKQHYTIQPGDVVLYQGKKYICGGCQHYGEYVQLQGYKSVPVKKVTIKQRAGGWIPVQI